MWIRDEPACKGNTFGSGSSGFKAASLIVKSARTIHQLCLPNISYNVIILPHYNRTSGRVNKKGASDNGNTIISFAARSQTKISQKKDIGEDRRVKRQQFLDGTTDRMLRQ
jgi:hypothetical protein